MRHSEGCRTVLGRAPASRNDSTKTTWSSSIGIVRTLPLLNPAGFTAASAVLSCTGPSTKTVRNKYSASSLTISCAYAATASVTARSDQVGARERPAYQNSSPGFPGQSQTQRREITTGPSHHVRLQPLFATHPAPSRSVTSWSTERPLWVSCRPLGQNTSRSTEAAEPRPKCNRGSLQE